MIPAHLEMFPDGTSVDCGGWGLIDLGFIDTDSRGERVVRWSDHDTVVAASRGGVVDILYGPFDRECQAALDYEHDAALCGPVALDRSAS